jgi:Alw26I/Eco31I/Esp3I family type II restriction endonuclease
MAKKENRTWHKNFTTYTKFITTHPIYKGLFFELSKNGNVKWVVTGKSENGKKRTAWWDKQCKKNKIKIEPGCYAKIAVLLHPTKMHVCQICGKSLSVKYIYPNKRLLNIIKKDFNKNYKPYTKDIFKIIRELSTSKEAVEKLTEIFQAKDKKIIVKKTLLDYVKKHHVGNCSKKFLSPGVMSNSPDRYDGFHSDCNSCRPKSDKGRHKENLNRYGEDRRAYENWADGDWKAASWLMQKFREHNVSPDHIGPISLGFSHNPQFNPMTPAKNSAKNNRMTLSDVKTLIKLEKEGANIVSWHSKYIWDFLKSKVKNNSDALRLSKIMHKNLHNVLTVLALIAEAGYDKFLVSNFLHPEHAYFSISFKGFNPKDGSYEEMIKTPGKKKQYSNNEKRYIRISLESLDAYKKVKNRNTKTIKSKNVQSALDKTLLLLKNGNDSQAKKGLRDVYSKLSKELAKDF